MKRTLVAALGTGAAAAAWLALTARRDDAAVRDDPRRDELDVSRIPAGEERTVTTGDGVPLHVRIVGPEGAPTLILVHGWMCSIDFWSAQLIALSRDCRVVAYDLRGHGGSITERDAAFGTEQLADDLHAVLEAAVPAGQRAILVGHSMGAMSIVAWAHRHPQDVERFSAAAVLANTGVSDLVTDSLLVRTPDSWHAARHLAGRLFLQTPTPPTARSPISHRIVRYVALSPNASPAQVRHCENVVLRCPQRVRTQWGRTLSRLDLRDGLAHLTVPTTVIASELDRLTPPVHARRLAEALPNLFAMVEMEGIGHMSPVEAPQVFDAEIRRLAAAVAASAATVAGPPA